MMVFRWATCGPRSNNAGRDGLNKVNCENAQKQKERSEALHGDTSGMVIELAGLKSKQPSLESRQLKEQS